MLTGTARTELQEAAQALFATSLAADPAAVYGVTQQRIPCCDSLISHKHLFVTEMPVYPERQPALTLLGLVNGVLRAVGCPALLTSLYSQRDHVGGDLRLREFALLSERNYATTQTLPGSEQYKH